jgi:hypothetical protein
LRVSKPEAAQSTNPSQCHCGLNIPVGFRRVETALSLSPPSHNSPVVSRGNRIRIAWCARLLELGLWCCVSLLTMFGTFRYFGVESSEPFGSRLSFALEAPANFCTRPVRQEIPMITTGGVDENCNDVEWFDCFSRASLRVVAPPSARHRLLTWLARVSPLATSALQPGRRVETPRTLRGRHRTLFALAGNSRWHMRKSQVPLGL